jgi:hypothetical protein
LLLIVREQVFMKILVKLHGVFRVDRFKEELQSYPDGSDVQVVVDSLKLSISLLGIVLINGIHAAVGQLLHDGDTLSLLPILDGG